jgi:glucose/mannose-6-phosphate isomerase
VSNVKGYLLPKTVDSKTLVIATSVSGKTMETIQILKNVKNSSATAVGFSSGGMLEQYCKNQDIFFQKIPMIHSPRASYTSFLFSILNILEPILPIKEKDVKDTITSLNETKINICSKNLTDENKSLKLAEFTNDITCIYHAAGLQASAVRFKNSLQENAKTHCMVEDVIESSHNGIVPWEIHSNVKPVLIQGKDDHEKTASRWKILKEFFEMKEIDFKVIESVDGNILSKITNLIYLLDYSTIYLAILKNIDPSPVRSIDFIKSKLEIQE